MSQDNLDDVISPEKEFENDVLSQFGFEGPEPIPGDNEGEGETSPGDTSEAYDGEAEFGSTEEQPDTPGEPEPDHQATEQVESQTPDQVTQDNQQNFNVKPDQKGNLIDPNGRIVARAGSERRLYEAKTKAERNFADIREKFEEHLGLMEKAGTMIGEQQARIQELENGGIQKQFNINDEEAKEAFHVYNLIKNDATALDGLKYVLTKAAERGIDIKSLGASGAAIDPRVLAQSITSQMDQKLAPITQQYTQQQAEAQKREEATKQVKEFFSRNPDAQPHAQTLSQIKRDPRYSGMSLDEAWSRLQAHLKDQEIERLKADQSQPQQPAPMPRGVPRPTAPQGPRTSVDNSPVNADMAFRDIVKGVLNDYGSDFE